MTVRILRSPLELASWLFLPKESTDDLRKLAIEHLKKQIRRLERHDAGKNSPRLKIHGGRKRRSA